MITWQTPAGNLGIIIERVLQDITLQVTSNVGTISYSIISGSLPRGLRLTNSGHIVGSPVEVKRFTTSRFVVRANDGADLEDRTFSLSVDGADIPRWITTEGYLNVGPANAYFVLDNSRVEFQLDAADTDLTAGDNLEFYLVPMAGELPPGLSLSKSGLISGFTDPIFALEYNDITSGGYDTAPLDVIPLDFVEARSNGFDSYFYDNQTFDYSEPSRTPRRLSRIYNFVDSVTDGIASVNRLFKIYVVTEEFLQADNSLLQVDTNLFQADSASDRFPLWITESNLGRFRANNYVTIFLEVYDPPTLSGTITYFLLPTNPDSSPSIIPPGMELDSITGEIAGRVPYQSAVTKQYTFSLVAVNFPATLANLTYTLIGNWNSSTTYQINDAVRYLGFIYICTQANKNKVPADDSEFWYRGVSSADKTFTVDLIGEIESSVEWLTDSDRGTIKPNQPSQLYIEAKSLLYGGRIAYDFISGTLPPGLEFLSTGIIQGKVRQFADSQGNGLTRFYDVIDGQVSYDISFDGGGTTLDKVFSFTIRARDAANFAESLRTFTITVIAENNKTFANLYVKAFQSKDKRLNWYNFITDATIFVPNEIYRYGDTAFGIQTDLKLMVYAGIESVEAVKYVQAMSRNHYRKRLLFGDINVAKAKDPATQETIYEVIYVDVVDEYEKDNKSISQTVNLKDNINSKVLISYDAIKVDSNVPLVSDADHQRIFPNSIKNMRTRIDAIGDRDREFLPGWMRSIQDTSNYEKGYTKALVLCYAKPGNAASIISRINAKTQYASRGEWSATANYVVNDTVFYKGFYFTCVADNQNKVPNIETEFWIRNFDFKSIDFTADRYIIDIIDGEIEDKYLAFPQRGEKLP
jgi:hypothetical protein